MARRLNRRQLQIVAGRAVQLYLEVSAGRRTARTMDRFATPEVREWIRNQFGSESRAQESLEKIALHPPRADGRIDVTALIRDGDRHVSVVTLQLQAVRDRWQICELDHLRRGQHRQAPEPAEPAKSGERRKASQAADLAVLRGAAAQTAAAAARAGHPADAERLTATAAQYRQRASDLARDAWLAPRAGVLLPRRDSNSMLRRSWVPAPIHERARRSGWKASRSSPTIARSGTSRTPSVHSESCRGTSHNAPRGAPRSRSSLTCSARSPSSRLAAPPTLTSRA